jgi:hypothetical protein
MLHTSFACNFTIESNPELPGTGVWHVEEVYIPETFRPKPNRGHLILSVASDSSRRILHVDANEVSEVWTTPNPDHLLITGWDTYYISLMDMSKVQEIPFSTHCVNVFEMPQKRLMLLYDYFQLVAVGTGGLLWQTERLVSDDLAVIRVEGTVIKCSGEWPASVDVDLMTGKVITASGPVAAQMKKKRSSLLGKLFSRLR